MKFLDNIFDKFIYWFDPPETEQQRESRIRFLQGLAPVHVGTISPTVSGNGSFASPAPPSLPRKGTWELRQDPFDPSKLMEVYVPALHEADQREIRDIVQGHVEQMFEGKKDTLDFSRLTSAIACIGSFNYEKLIRRGRSTDDLIKSLPALNRSVNVFHKFIEQTIVRADVEDLGIHLPDLVEASDLFIKRANKTYVSVLGHVNIHGGVVGWYAYPDKLPEMPRLAGKEAA